MTQMGGRGAGGRPGEAALLCGTLAPRAQRHHGGRDRAGRPRAGLASRPPQPPLGHWATVQALGLATEHAVTVWLLPCMLKDGVLGGGGDGGRRRDGDGGALRRGQARRDEGGWGGGFEAERLSLLLCTARGARDCAWGQGQGDPRFPGARKIERVSQPRIPWGKDR